MSARRLILAALLALLPVLALAAERASPPPEAIKTVPRISLTVGKSIVLTSKFSIGKASVADDKIADIAAPMLPGQTKTNQVYVAGKAPGLTTLTLWDDADTVRTVYDIEVAPDLTRLKKMLHSVMPDETGIEIHNNNDAIALSGTVRNALNVQKVLSLAESYAPGKVINLMSVGGVQQVMLEVRVAEMSRSLLKSLNININYLFQGDFVYTMLGGMTNVPLLQNIIVNSSDPTTKSNSPTRFDAQRSPLNIASTANAIVNINTFLGGSQVTWTGFVDVLKENGLVKILAEPTLVCLNGQTAEFLAGGEIPVPIPQALGTISIEWKKFGVELAFTPTVLTGNRISLKVSPSVSELDYANAIVINNFKIPAINKRSAATVIEMADGQSFAIAGLIKEQYRDTVSKYPALGDVPVLGSLFKSGDFQKNQSELVIIITPHLAKPMDKSITKLPTDGVKEYNDLEFYLNIPQSWTQPDKPAAQGKAAPADKSQPKGPAGSFDGDYGAAVPEISQTTGRGTGK